MTQLTQPVDLQTLRAGITTEKALALYDILEPASLDLMIGRWTGQEIPTQHPMDGMLETMNWYGKEFIDPETVHPLLFNDDQGNLFKLRPDPTIMVLAFKFPITQYQWLLPALKLLNNFAKTEKSQARLRLLQSRGAVTATMIYDNLPMNDSFKKIDDNTVLGLMDYKVIPQPYFFLLQRAS